jgi:FMN phosphatase YigB (HAD superfamily)
LFKTRVVIERTFVYHRIMAEGALLTDIDNTLFSWQDFFAPAFRAMVHALAKLLCVSEDSLYEDFKQVYASHGSLEYAFSIQELSIVKKLSIDQQRNAVKTGRGAFQSAYRANLRPYPAVMETLEWAHQQGIVLAAVTNSPAYMAQKRLYELQLDRLIKILIAWEGFQPEADDEITGEFVKDRSRIRSKTRLEQTIIINEAEVKPNTAHYVHAMRAIGVAPELTWVVGDSLHKDLAPASTLGMRTIWAKYGMNGSQKNLDTLLRITHWSKDKISSTYHDEGYSPDFVVTNFEELKLILPVGPPREVRTQLSLF